MEANPSITISYGNAADVSDSELEHVLRSVYVQEGFTNPEVARTIFAASAVRARGELIVAKHAAKLIGTLVLVPPTSPACRVAKAGEAELHLMAVLPEYRGVGLGARLMTSAFELAAERGYGGLTLSTQPNMHAAHRLYAAFGFARDPERDWTAFDRQFLVLTTRVPPAK